MASKKTSGIGFKISTQFSKHGVSVAIIASNALWPTSMNQEYDLVTLIGFDDTFLAVFGAIGDRDLICWNMQIVGQLMTLTGTPCGGLSWSTSIYQAIEYGRIDREREGDILKMEFNLH
ncbi:hypothetical protein L1987_87488 [Smallanthus sonchifolius]|nr:hypothetical protein L1987_87488 [Smallanthus sonchifolius]